MTIPRVPHVAGEPEPWEPRGQITMAEAARQVGKQVAEADVDPVSLGGGMKFVPVSTRTIKLFS